MRKVLLVEPDNNLSQQTCDFLERNSFDVVHVTEGTAAVQKAMEVFPDIILCDTEVSGLNGYEIFNTLLQINSTSVIPFVFLMDEVSNEDIRAAMNLGADDYLKKPYKQGDLLDLIETRLEKQEKIIGLADEKFNTLMEYSSDGVFIYQDEKLSYVNKKFCDLVDYSKRELIGMSLVNIVFKDDIQLVVDKIGRLLKGIHKNMQLEFKAIKGDRDLVSLEITGNSVNFKGKKSIVGTIKPKGEGDNGAFIPCKTNVNLTQREKEVLNFICDGNSNATIAEKLKLSERTVEGHRANLLQKTGCQNTARLVIFAVKYGFYKIAK